MGFEVEYKTLAHMMKTNKQTTQSSISKNTIQKRSVGRPRKLKIRVEPVSNTLPNYIQMSGTKNVPNKKIQTLKPLKSNSDISKAQMSSTSSLQNITHQPPITKTTSQLLRNMLLSSDRSKFHKSATHFKSNNEKSYNYYQPKWKNNGNIQNSNLSTYDIKPTIPVSYLPDLQSFPDIPQLADVDINASLDLDNSNFRMNYQTDVDTGFCGDGSDTLSNQSAEITEQEQRDIDQRWAMSIRMENGMTGTPFANHDTFNPFDNSSLLGPQDTALVQNDVIQNYIETNDVQFMQLPDSGCEVIKTLQYYESRLSNPWSLSENNGDGSVISNESVQNEQLNLAESNHTLAEFANMLPCPIAGCLWYSHSATLYVHLCTCHQDMIYYGNLITHIFRCQDIHNFCFFTHLQYVQNTIYIITVAFDPYSRVFVATIQHVSSYGDNTSVLSTTAVLTSGFLHNNNVSQNSWTGHVQPYIVPLDVLHNDGKCLFIDPPDSDQHVVISVNLTTPLMYSNNSMFACL